jgi:hypothetical protein
VSAASIPVAVQISNVSSHPPVDGRSYLLELALLVIGLVLIVYSAFGLANTRRWRGGTRLAQAAVVDNIPHPTGRRHPRWQAIVAFEVDGAPIVSRLETRATSADYPPGTQIYIRYDPADPRRIGPTEIGNSAGAWLIIGLVIVMFAVMI